jgi:hypothetical protein
MPDVTVDMTRTHFCDSARINVPIRAHGRARAAGGGPHVVVQVSQRRKSGRFARRRGDTADETTRLPAKNPPTQGVCTLGMATAVRIGWLRGTQ